MTSQIDTAIRPLSTDEIETVAGGRFSLDVIFHPTVKLPAPTIVVDPPHPQPTKPHAPAGAIAASHLSSMFKL